MISLKKTIATSAGAALLASFISVSGAGAATLLDCGSDTPDVGGTGGAAGATIYDKTSANVGDFDFLIGTDANDGVVSCTTVDNGGQAQVQPADLVGVGGINDWAEHWKLNTNEGNIVSDNDASDGVVSSLNNEGGSITIDSSIGASNYLVVFKDGNATPESIVAYVINGVSDGFTASFLSPFFNHNDTTKWKAAISNISVWKSGSGDDCPPGNFNCPNPTTPEVPLPAGLPLMLTALGIGAYMRKRARKVA